MGMYDYIVCHMLLPGTAPSWLTPDTKFQTKDTPEQYLATYTISKDGSLSGPDAGTFTGTIEFYSSNESGRWGGIVYTTGGQDAESAEYMATVVLGKVTEIKQTAYSIGPAIPQRPLMAMTPAEVEAHRAKYAGPWVGRTIYVLMGGSDVGYTAEVLAETDSKLSVRVVRCDGGWYKNGDIETIHKSFGSTIFRDESEALESRKVATEMYESAQLAFAAYAEQWHNRRKAANAAGGAK